MIEEPKQPENIATTSSEAQEVEATETTTQKTEEDKKTKLTFGQTILEKVKKFFEEVE